MQDVGELICQLLTVDAGDRDPRVHRNTSHGHLGA